MVTSPISSEIIEELLNEFNHNTTTNDRKREIEIKLLEFQNSPNVWQQCLQNLLMNTTNEYVWFFNIQTIELTISRQWRTLSPPERNLLRETLWTNYVNLTDMSPKIKREKIAQLLALMGKREFPDEHSTYMKHIVDLLNNNYNLGILLLRVTSEEAVSTKCDIYCDQKKYFQSCVSSCMPEIFELLNNFLKIFINKIDNINISECGVPNYLELLDDNQLSIVTIELLNCIQHLLTWITLENVISEYFLINLFNLAMWQQQRSKTSVAALLTICELFYPQRALPLPHTIFIGIKNLLQQSNLETSTDLYQDKMTELLRIFTTQHWEKLSSDENVLENIIIGIYQYTFIDCGPFAFTEKLKIWCPIIERLPPNTYGRFTNVIHSLVDGILKRMQFRFDETSRLNIFDDVDNKLVDFDRIVDDNYDNYDLDDNTELCWLQYILCCTNTLVTIAMGRPIPVFEQIFAQWQRPYELFVSLEKVIDNYDINRWQFNHWVFCDLSTLCFILSNVIPFVGDFSKNVPENFVHLVNHLVYSVKYITSPTINNLIYHHPTLNVALNIVFTQILAAIRNLLSPAFENNESEIIILIESIGQILLPSSTSPFSLAPSSSLSSLQQNVSKSKLNIINLSAADLLLNITSILRPKYILAIPSIIQLIQFGNNLTHLPDHIIKRIQGAIVNCFVLPWHNCTYAQQDIDTRNLHLQKYISNLAHDVLHLDNIMAGGIYQRDKIIVITTSILPNLKCLIDTYDEHTSFVKNLLVVAFKPIISKLLSLFRNCGSNVHCAELTNSILSFSFSIIKTLQIQLGTNYIQEMLNIFLLTIIRGQVTKCHLKAIDILLKMLLLVVEQPGMPTITLIPPILNYTLNCLIPLLMENKYSLDCSEVAISLYKLFDGILHLRWQYFYKSHVLRGFSPVTNDLVKSQHSIDGGDEQPQHSEQLLAILTAYGKAFVTGNDPHLKRVILMSLQSLNERWKLFDRDIFKRNLLSSFHNALINTLISQEGALYYDLLLSVLFKMGRVNCIMLQKTFCDLGFPLQSQIVEEICSAMDLPTFSCKMSQLIQDTRHSQSSK